MSITTITMPDGFKFKFVNTSFDATRQEEVVEPIAQPLKPSVVEACAAAILKKYGIK